MQKTMVPSCIWTFLKDSPYDPKIFSVMEAAPSLVILAHKWGFFNFAMSCATRLDALRDCSYLKHEDLSLI